MRRTFPRSPVVAATARFSDATINTALRGSLIASLIWTLLVGALLLGAILARGLAAVAAEANEATAPAARPLTGVVIDAQGAGVPAIGGHSHTQIDPAIEVNGVLIAQTGGTASTTPASPDRPKYLGQISLTLENERVVEKRGQVFKFPAPRTPPAAASP